jgi:hypothetical protein
MRGNVGRILAGAAMGLAAVLPMSGAAARTLVSAPRVLPCAGRPQVRPTNYLMSCADANASWKNVVWKTWGAKSATGTGELYQNDCTPNCAAGHFHTYAARLLLTKVVKVHKYGLLYSEATFSYSVAGKQKSETFGLAT